MIDLRRRGDGAPLRIGHRGAAHLAPENTLRAMRAAVEHGCDLIEFDVLALRRGPLVLAHSDHLDEVSHGGATGRVRDKSLAELRAVAPELPTLDEALAFFVDEAPEVGLHVDLKLDERLDELAAAISASRARDPHGRLLVPRGEPAHRRRARTASCASASRIRRTGSACRVGRTSGRWWRSGSRPCGRPSRPGVRRLTARAGATALMLQHRLVTARAVERAHGLGLPVLAWTVDDREELERVTRLRRRRGDHERPADLLPGVVTDCSPRGCEGGDRPGYTGRVRRRARSSLLGTACLVSVLAAVAVASPALADDGDDRPRRPRRRARSPRA